MTSGWGELELQQPRSGGYLPASAGRETHQLADAEVEEQGRTMALGALSSPRSIYHTFLYCEKLL